ncbi:MAG: hypothetical protein WCK47_05190 [bacterium]|nr:hypothetical protein [Candidatus Sumerlaeota bacterium]
MRLVKLLAVLSLVLFVFGGCAWRAKQPTGWGRPTTMGLKSADQVAPCCRDLALGRISLAECMQKPECKANGNRCCANAISDMSPN